jgi:hypothetical protein
MYKWALAALRALVLRTLVFLTSLTRKTGHCAPLLIVLHYRTKHNGQEPILHEKSET